MEYVRSVCPIDCPDACGLILGIDNDIVHTCQGDPEHPFTRGFICGKMRRYPERLNSSHRLKYPLRRAGAKGTNAFERITWDEAIETIRVRWQEIINKYGAEAILPYSYAGTMGLVQRNSGHAFFHRLGASRLKRTICAVTADAGWTMTLGDTMGSDVESIVHSDFVIIWGMNVASTHVHFLPFLRQAKANGAQVIQIDCYENRTSAFADQVIKVYPGTDAALALGLMNVLVRDGLLDREFIENYTYGFEALGQKVLAEYDVQRVSAITGVPAPVIEELARSYGKAKAPYIRVGAGPCRQWDGAMVYRALACLPGLVGAFRKKGGGIFVSSNTGQAFYTGLITREDFMLKPTREINMIKLGKALLTAEEPPVQSLYVYHANPATVAPDQQRVLAGLARPDLFTVVHEQFMTDTALYADIVLPATASVEHGDIYRSYGHYYVQAAKASIPPPGEAKSNLEVFSLLAKAFGFEEDHFQRTADDLIEQLLLHERPLLAEIDHEALRQGKAVRLSVGGNPPLRFGQFQTKTGKLMFENPELVELGYPTLPDYRPREKSREEQSYPIRLLANPGHYFLNGTFGENENLRLRAGVQTILMNEEEAKERDIADGQWVRVHNLMGDTRFVAAILPGVPKGVAVVEGVHWHSYTPGGKNVNHLITSKETLLAEGSCFNDNYVEIEPAS